VTEIARRFIAWVWRFGIGARLLLVVLMVWSTVVMDDYRVPGGPALSMLNEVRVPLMVVSFLMLAHSFSTLRIWNKVYHIVRMLERLAPVIVLAVAALATGEFVSAVVEELVPPDWHWALEPLGALQAVGAVLSGRILVVVFVCSGFLITEVLLVRLVGRLTEGDGGHADTGRRVKAIVFWTFGAYFGCCIVFAYNAMLDVSQVTTHRSEATRVTRRSLAVGVFSYEVSWLHLRSWRHPGQEEQITAHRWRDGYWFSDVWPGMPLLVNVRGGLLGMPWVDTAPIDRMTLLERLVKELPTAVAPRKELIAGSLAEARWDAAARHAREYQALYPEDRTFVDSVLRAIPPK
jgi:hypothetical protein